ncbi:hypothetical protein TYRP_021273 [Tyrophagus putrescentiae]|nr:hypothetical protein TYRP_021273 [Tyrophagus putrescentiae]
MKFNSKLLFLFTTFYGHMGNQLHPIVLGSAESYLHLGVNISFNILFLYYIRNDLFLSLHMLAIFDTFKPIFALLTKIFLFYAQEIILVVNFCFSFWYGPQITTTLNSALFNSVRLFNDARKVRLYFTAFLALDLALFFISYHFQLVQYFSSGAWGASYSLGATVVLFCLSSNTHLYLHLCLYWQYGTYVVLGQQQKESLTSLKEIIAKVRSLAELNDRLFSLASFPLATFLFMVVFCTIATIGMFSLVNFRSFTDALFLVYPVTTIGYIFAVVRLNGLVLEEFDRLVDYLKGGETEMRSATDKRRQLGLTGYNWRKPVAKKASLWSKIKVHELKLKYRGCFQFRLFSLQKVDTAFLFACLLFILNIVVFLVQTK